MNKKVAVALSGGVDSAVTAKLLIEEGFEVVGLTGKMTCSDDFETVVQNAKRVADKLGIEHYVYDATKEFGDKVIKYFENSYAKAETPNPCIMCNKYIKWGCLFDYAVNVLGADYIATGHYANIKDGVLYPASDEHKDQLYFLYMLDKDKLEKTLFPLSKYRKDEVRALAEKYDLPPKSSKESQDICFIKAPMTTKKYLNNIFEPRKGDFVEKSTGKVLGHHDGFWQYTIGQRKGIGIAAPYPLYVIEIDSQTNTVFVGRQDELFTKELILDNVNWSGEFEALVKIRYNMKAVQAKVCDAKITFEEPVSAVTKGQACVLYDINDGHLIGGAII